MAEGGGTFDDVGEYRVKFHPIFARGVFGIVYNARHKTTNKEVVAKSITMESGTGSNSEARERALNEWDILSRLKSHNNITKLLSCVQKDDTLFLFLELCDKGHLGSYVEKNPNLPLSNRIRIMGEIASAIQFMHDQKPPILHRDLKLENILLKREGLRDVVKVTDFGLSKIYERNKSLSTIFNPRKKMMTTCGSQYFMAPEFFAELEGGTVYDEAVDTFSLALIMKVLIEYTSSNMELIPLSVSSRQAKKDVCYGYELVVKFNSKEPMPYLFEEEQHTNKYDRRLRRIISHMAVLEPYKRKAIKEVHEEISEMLSDMKEASASSNISELTLTSTSEPLGEQTQQGSGVDLLSLTSSTLHEERRVKLRGRAVSLCVAHGRLYTCECERGLGVYSLELKLIGYLTELVEQSSSVYGAAEAGDQALAVAAWRGLFIVSRTGEVLQQLGNGVHDDVCGDGHHLYTTCRDSSSDRQQLHVYQQQQGSWVKTRQYDTPCTNIDCDHLIEQINRNVYLSCDMQNCIYKFNINKKSGIMHKHVDSFHADKAWQKLGGEKELQGPRVSAVDEQGSVLIIDRGYRLVVMSAAGRITELRTEPRLDAPMRAVIVGSNLYVIGYDQSLRCFKIK